MSKNTHSSHIDTLIATADTPRPEHRPYAPSHKSNQANSADGYGHCESDCGDSIAFYIQLADDDTLLEVTCKVHGCDNTILSARAAALLVKGRSLQEAMSRATAEEINTLTQFEDAHRHCAALAADALRAALTDAVITRRDPWRRLYRKP